MRIAIIGTGAMGSVYAGLLADAGLDVSSATVETLGADAVDAFYVCDPGGAPIDPDKRRRAEQALAAAARGEAPDPASLRGR